MKKVICLMASARKKGTHYAASRFMEKLEAYGNVKTEMIQLDDYRIETCRGCQVCFAKGETYCPLKDDRDVLIQKMMAADGVIFATPNYAFQVAGFLKIFIERLGYALHRPQFFGKIFTSIVVQGIYGGNEIKKYLDFIGSGLGFNTVKGSVITALQPITESEKRKIDKILSKQSAIYYKKLFKFAYPKPSLFRLMAFRMGRTSIRLELTERDRDFNYYREKGWFKADYYYPVRLGIFQKLAGTLFDETARLTSKSRHT
ncbi:MAG: NADPH-dependent FMN reductase [Anaerolineaceae bacterium]|nr:NADPH-dependent FMN reductase [Anaerolineaceae bacterium]